MTAPPPEIRTIVCSGTPLQMGRDYGEQLSNVLTKGDILQAIETTRGVRTATLTVPAGNFSMDPDHILQAPGDLFAAGTGLQVLPVES